MHLLAIRAVFAGILVSFGAVLLPWVGLTGGSAKVICLQEAHTQLIPGIHSASTDVQSEVATIADRSSDAPKQPPRLIDDVSHPSEATSGETKKADRAMTASGHTLTRSGRLNLDPSRLARIHARFAGQVIAVGQAEIEPGYAVDRPIRPLQFGDAVKKGQLLAVVWSREVGEKKSELLHAVAQVFQANRQLVQAQSLVKGAERDRQLSEAERHVNMSALAVDRIERTLHSWKMSADEIQEVRDEARRMQHSQAVANPQLERSWAEVKVWAPFDGVVLERNVSLGEVVDHRLDLFKIGDVSTLGVTIDVYEEDLPALESLGAESRNWLVRLKSEPGMPGIPGSFEVIANMVDPHRHTVSVLGTLDNSQGLLRAGQFVTAEICLK